MSKTQSQPTRNPSIVVRNGTQSPLETNKEKENLCNLEKKSSSLSGGKGFPVSPNTLKEHFRSLEERKKQHKEGLYLSDTLPRKKTTPSISPHFSSATMGRSTAPKAHLPLGQSNSCGSVLPHSLATMTKDSESRRMLRGRMNSSA
ncbi:PREDICTED: pleckstrin homology-like domain family B member 2, partial [Galeopterus variegatus]|uniref:Pleckstrin homology-like domain family B member 2 n=1 Tax=Galeopterus variegatus TaxID=482537 RepID=A0ABM0REV9_GALVR